MEIKKVSFEKNFDFYYTDCTYEVNTLVLNSNLSPEVAIVFGRFLSFTVIANSILKPFFPTKEVIFEMNGSNCGIYQIKINQYNNLSVYIQKPQLSYNSNFNNEDLDVEKFVLGNFEKKFRFHMYNSANNEEIEIHKIKNFTSKYGNICEDLLLYLNNIGMKRAALSLGVEFQVKKTYEVLSSGGYLCHVKNRYENENLIQNLKKNLDNSLLIKELQNKYNHNDEKIIRNVIKNFECEIQTIDSYYINKEEIFEKKYFEYEMLNKSQNEFDFLLCGVNFAKNKIQCFWVNLVYGKQQKMDVEAIKFLENKDVCYYIQNLNEEIEFSGNSHQLSYFIFKKYQNQSYAASGCVDKFGKIHYVNSVLEKIRCFEKFGMKKIFLPLENKMELKNKLTKFKVEIKFVSNLSQI